MRDALFASDSSFGASDLQWRGQVTKHDNMPRVKQLKDTPKWYTASGDVAIFELMNNKL